MNTQPVDYDALPLWKQRVADIMNQDFHKQTEHLHGEKKTSYALR